MDRAKQTFSSVHKGLEDVEGMASESLMPPEATCEAQRKPAEEATAGGPAVVNGQPRGHLQSVPVQTDHGLGSAAGLQQGCWFLAGHSKMQRGRDELWKASTRGSQEQSGVKIPSLCRWRRR